MQLNIWSLVPKTHDDNVYAHSSCKPVYGINLEGFFKKDLSWALHGKCLCQEFNNMLVHYVKTNVPVKHFTVHQQRTIALHVPPDKIFTKCRDQFTCCNCFSFAMWKIGATSILNLLVKLFFSSHIFPKEIREKYLLWVWS